MFKSQIWLHFLAVPLLMLIHPYASNAEGVNSFYQHNVARDLFTDYEVDSQQSIYKSFPAETARFGRKEMAGPEEALTEVPTEEQEAKKELSPAELLYAKYGDPKAEPVLHAHEDAPEEFKVIMEALEMGEGELAEQYARKWVKYLGKLQTRSQEVLSVTGKALKAEGRLPDGSWADSDNFIDVGLRNPVLNETETVDGTARAQLNPQLGPKTLEEEQEARKALRKKYAKKIPVDPKGEVDVYFFFKPGEQNSRDMMPVIEKLNKIASDDPKLRVIAILPDNVSILDFRRFREKLKFRVDVTPGIELAKQFEIKQTPTTVLAARNTGKAVFAKGQQPFHYLDEMIQGIKGL